MKVNYKGTSEGFPSRLGFWHKKPLRFFSECETRGQSITMVCGYLFVTFAVGVCVMGAIAIAGGAVVDGLDNRAVSRFMLGCFATVPVGMVLGALWLLANEPLARAAETTLTSDASDAVVAIKVGFCAQPWLTRVRTAGATQRRVREVAKLSFSDWTWAKARIAAVEAENAGGASTDELAELALWKEQCGRERGMIKAHLATIQADQYLINNAPALATAMAELSPLEQAQLALDRAGRVSRAI